MSSEIKNKNKYVSNHLKNLRNRNISLTKKKEEALSTPEKVMFLITIFNISSVIEGMHWVRKRPPPGNQLPFSKRKTIYLSFFNLLSPLKTEFDLSLIFTQLVVSYL